MDDEKIGEKDAAVSAWMQAQGWWVTERHYSVRLSWYLWRSHDVKPVITLFITRNVFDDHTATELVRILDSLQARQYLQTAPYKYTVILEDEMGEARLKQLDELPKDEIRSAQVSAH